MSSAVNTHAVRRTLQGERARSGGGRAHAGARFLALPKRNRIALTVRFPLARSTPTAATSALTDDIILVLVHIMGNESAVEFEASEATQVRAVARRRSGTTSRTTLPPAGRHIHQR